MASRHKAKTPVGETSMAGVRLSSEISEKVGAHMDRMKKANPWATISQSDALRDLILIGLKAVEKTA